MTLLARLATKKDIRIYKSGFPKVWDVIKQSSASKANALYSALSEKRISKLAQMHKKMYIFNLNKQSSYLKIHCFAYINIFELLRLIESRS